MSAFSVELMTVSILPHRYISNTSKFLKSLRTIAKVKLINLQDPTLIKSDIDKYC